MKTLVTFLITEIRTEWQLYGGSLYYFLYFCVSESFHSIHFFNVTMFRLFVVNINERNINIEVKYLGGTQESASYKCVLSDKTLNFSEQQFPHL